MKKLIWKELMEMRWIAVLAAVTTILSCILMKITLPIILMYPDARAVRIGPSQIPYMIGNIAFMLCTKLPAAVCGSLSIADETKHGTLGFLSILPSGRTRLWVGKIIANLIIIAFCLLLSVPPVISESQSFFGALASNMGRIKLDSQHPAFYLNYGFFLINVLNAYAISLLISTLVDRPLAALVLSVIIIYTLPLAIAALPFTHAWDAAAPSVVRHITAAMETAAALCASYFAFTRGETLRTRKRFEIAGTVLAAWAAIAWVVISLYAYTHSAA